MLKKFQKNFRKGRYKKVSKKLQKSFKKFQEILNLKKKSFFKKLKKVLKSFKTVSKISLKKVSKNFQKSFLKVAAAATKLRRPALCAFVI